MNESRRALTELDLERMMIPRRFWQARFAEVDHDQEGVSPQDVIRRYMANLDQHLRDGNGLYLWGPNGRGKTGAAVVVAMEVRRRNRTALFVSASDLRRIVIDQVPFDGEQLMIDRAVEVDLLLLDDLGKGVMDDKAFGERLLDDLLRKRSSELRSTILTANMDPATFRTDYKASTAEVLKECMVAIEFRGEDKRDQKRQSLLAAMA